MVASGSHSCSIGTLSCLSGTVGTGLLLLVGVGGKQLWWMVVVVVGGEVGGGRCDGWW